MKFEVSLAGGKKAIEVKSPRRKSYRAYMVIAQKVMADPKFFEEFEDTKDKLVVELSGLTIEEVNNLKQDEFKKIISFIEGKFIPNTEEKEKLKN